MFSAVWDFPKLWKQRSAVECSFSGKVCFTRFNARFWCLSFRISNNVELNSNNNKVLILYHSKFNTHTKTKCISRTGNKSECNAAATQIASVAFSQFVQCLIFWFDLIYFTNKNTIYMYILNVVHCDKYIFIENVEDNTIMLMDNLFPLWSHLLAHIILSLSLLLSTPSSYHSCILWRSKVSLKQTRQEIDLV